MSEGPLQRVPFSDHIRSGWGLGVLTRGPSSFTHLAMHPFGANLGGWTLAAGDTVEGVADFSGDGGADLLVRGSSGRAVLGLSGSALTVRASYPFGSWIGGAWNHGAGDRVVAIGNFSGDRGAELVISSGWGVGVISASPWTYLVDAASYNALFGSWLLDSRDTFFNGGDLDRDGYDELLVQTAD